MDISEILQICLFIFLFAGAIAFICVLVYACICAINHHFGLDKKQEVQTIVQQPQPQQPTIIKIEQGSSSNNGKIKKPELESSKKEPVELFVEDNPMLKKKKIEDIKIETSFKKGKRIGKRK